jgi:alkanesulfonate monooxygenase SsuD/methylene tetrahydromethanopterin reductase-like flavin-dependent oxidoreductase (luciferase family)
VVFRRPTCLIRLGSMKVPIGLHLTNFSFPGVADVDRFDHAVAIARTAEEAGFDTLWVNDHLIEGQPPNQGGSRPDVYMYLATVAAHTTRIRLGALASSIYFRNPALLARMVVTLDEASKGRAILGVGAGHPMTESEHRGFGLEFPPIRERIDRLEATLPQLRELVGSIPILVAGSGEHRLLRVVARYGDMCNLSMPSGDTAEVTRHRLDVLRAHCVAVGRDYLTITKTYKGFLAPAGSPGGDDHRGVFSGDEASILHGAQEFVDLGIDELIVQMAQVHDLAAVHSAGQTLTRLKPAGRPV